MRILIVMDPIEGADLTKDTTVGFILAAQSRGHSVYYCDQSQGSGFWEPFGTTAAAAVVADTIVALLTMKVAEDSQTEEDASCL